MVDTAKAATGETIPAPGLLIVTGASHAGKTTVAEAILAAVPPPAAYLSVDDVLERTLLRSPGDIWTQIPLAYELLCSELKILLERGWFVVVESTFTYVPSRGEPEFHVQTLDLLIGEARSRDIPAFIAHLKAPGDIVRDRAERTGRLDQAIVAATVDLHDSASLPISPLAIDTDALDARESAALILERIGAKPSLPGN